MLKDKVKKDPGAAKKRGYQLVEMSDGTLRVRSGWAYAYILPAMALLLLFTVYPLVMVLRTAFYQKYIYITNTGKGFGLSSFAWVLKDSTFWMACKNTAILLLIALPITLILALGIALLINSIKRLQGLFQTIYFLPYVTSTIAIGMAFLWLFHSDYGYINYFLQLFGISPQKWLTDPNLMIVTLSIFSVWNGLAFKILLFLAGLQKINKQVYQAARIDGSSPTVPHYAAPAESHHLDGDSGVRDLRGPHFQRGLCHVRLLFRRSRRLGKRRYHHHVLHLLDVLRSGKGQLRCGSRHSVSDRRPSHHGGTAGGLQEICPLRVREGTR